MIKRTLFLAVCCMLALQTWAAAIVFPEVSAQSAVLYDVEYGRILYEKHADRRMGIASTTKIMTALVALEQYDMDAVVRIQPEWCGIEGSSIYLRPDEMVPVSDLLYGLLLESGNDAAAALAGFDPDGISGFVEKMNRKAEELGLENTHFDNPSGLDSRTHYSTAKELAVLSAAAMQHPDFRKIAGCKYHLAAERSYKNHNKLLWKLDACGIKTGYTKACGRCLVSAKTVQGRKLICVTLNAPSDWDDHQAMYRAISEQLQAVRLIGIGEYGTVPLVSSSKSCVRIFSREEFDCFLTEEEKKLLSFRVYGPRFLYGSVEAGGQYGLLRVLLCEKVLFETPLYYAEGSLEIQPEESIFSKFFDLLFRRRQS